MLPHLTNEPFLLETSVVNVAVSTEKECVSQIRLNATASRCPETPFEFMVAQQLGEYIAGDRHDFTIRVLPSGTTFQLQVWRAILEIPFGQTATYGEVARRIGKPAAARAVGAAAHANPVPIIIPCHRVVGRNGTLVGFGGGLDLKRRLLAIEARGLIDLPPEMGYLSAVQ
jgi:methylated-DNA-[protein]-cysteine S-methyltransferase